MWPLQRFNYFPGNAPAVETWYPLSAGPVPIRNWAADNGYHVSTRGRIAREIVEAFEAAH
ncbi:hypothetical protein GS502_10620 [Rhodococcus hoagii]|nr:hypothetical protein [Prescottella equi]